MENSLSVLRFAQGLARWSLLRYTVPNVAPVIYLVLNHFVNIVVLPRLPRKPVVACQRGCVQAPSLRHFLAQNLKL